MYFGGYDAELSQLDITYLNYGHIVDHFEIKGLDKFTKLQNLRFSGVNVTKIEGLDRLTQLQELVFSENQITKIEGLEKLVLLTNLVISTNMVTKIEGLESLTQLKRLYINENGITEIEGLEQLSRLLELNLSQNKISEIKGVELLTQLRYLFVSDNKIKEIKGLGSLSQLRYLSLSNNKIKEIKGLEQLKQLRVLELGCNRIIKIEGLESLSGLRHLYLNNNQITKIEGLESLTSLQGLKLYNNQIKEIEGLERLTQLKKLKIYNNKITTIPFTIMNTYSLIVLTCDCEIDPIIQRFLDRNILRSNKLAVYSDSQNVHDSNIHKSISESIYRLLVDKVDFEEVLKDITNDETLTPLTKNSLIEYSNLHDVHSILNVTFKEILQSVWYVIKNHTDSEQIKIILNDEMRDSLCKCFTGRISRLTNCLSGFDDRVSIKISDNSEISNIIVLIRDKYENIEDQRREVHRELTDRGYKEDVINEWLSYL